MGEAGPSEPELAAVLTALAGVRRGDAVVALGVGRITLAALAAGCGAPLLDPRTAPPACAVVVVIGDRSEQAEGRRLLRPGGRFVCLSANEAAARIEAREAGVALRFLESVGEQVAWSAQAPFDPTA